MKFWFGFLVIFSLVILWYGRPGPAWAQAGGTPAVTATIITPLPAAPTATSLPLPTATPGSPGESGQAAAGATVVAMPTVYGLPPAGEAATPAAPGVPVTAGTSGVVANAGGQSTGPLAAARLPDLQPLPPFDLQLLANPSSGARLLRFSNSFANVGSAPLDLRGELDPNTLVVTLVQQVRGLNGVAAARRLGGFEYHPEHGHWHWQGFSVYEIWSLGLNAGLEQALVLSGKVGYCMMDTSRANTTWLDNQGLLDSIPFAGQNYTSCGWRRQGISPGWVDTYLRHLPGQVMDISSLPDGLYALRSIVDPEGLLAEANTENNAALVYFRLEGARLRVIEDERLVRAGIFQQLYGDQPFYDEEDVHNLCPFTMMTPEIPNDPFVCHK